MIRFLINFLAPVSPAQQGELGSIKIGIRAGPGWTWLDMAGPIYVLNLTGICHSMEFIGTNLIEVIRCVIVSDGDI